ncbi:transport particle subunit bet5 [Fusarium sporotrichioides]|uniref:Trafficking protein particle complex subunit n=1 Tax=Fusarium sporotrichioides TaxID=5514 RepID=A0A395S249_FUSSP|nr:transport particle subunit bet5 [Fusarium sporotrichioides]
MVVYSFHIFDRHSKQHPRPILIDLPANNSLSSQPSSETAAPTTSSDDAKLLFGTVFSLRNMVRKLGGDDDAFISYRTAQYKLHFYETPANLRFVILTDTATLSMRNVLHQIYINLWVEYVVKNPLAPVEHKKGEGVKNELFELGLDQFIRGLIQQSGSSGDAVYLRKEGYYGLENAHIRVQDHCSSTPSPRTRRRIGSKDDMTMFPGVKQSVSVCMVLSVRITMSKPHLTSSAE